MNKPTFLNRITNAQFSVIVLLLCALILANAGLFVPTLSVLMLIFAGLLFGVFVHSISFWPTKHTQLSYHSSFLVVVALMLVTIGISCFYLGSQIVRRADELWLELQSSLKTADKKLSQNDWASENLPSVSEMRNSVSESANSFLPEMFQGLQWVGWGVTGAFVVFFIGLYAAYEPNLYRAGMIKLVPKDHRGRVREVLNKLNSALRLWIVGRLLSMTIVGVATALVMWLLGIPLPASLGILAALLTFIPNIGPLLATVPQMILALNVGAQAVLFVLLFNLILQTVESYLITPIIQRHEVALPPILTIAAQLVMGVLIGIVGVMMAAPLMVAGMVLVQMLYVEDRLGDEQSGHLTNDSL